MNKLTVLAWALKIWLLIGQWLLAADATLIGRGNIRPNPGPFPIPIPEPPPPGASGGLRAEHELVRRARGLYDFRKNDKLTKIAQEWAEHCQRIGRIDHFGADGSTPWSRATAAGYAYSGLSENLAWGQRNAREAVQDWLTSPGHASNVLSAQWTEVGYGQAGIFWCAVYARPAGLQAPSAPSQTLPPPLRARPQTRPVYRSRCSGCCR